MVTVLLRLLLTMMLACGGVDSVGIACADDGGDTMDAAYAQAAAVVSYDGAASCVDGVVVAGGDGVCVCVVVDADAVADVDWYDDEDCVVDVVMCGGCGGCGGGCDDAVVVVVVAVDVL